MLPAEGIDLDVVLGSSPGASAQVAAARGLPFAASYHTTPSTVLETVEADRSAFQPSKRLGAPHVMVSADVVVADTDERAAELAAPVRTVGARHPLRARRTAVRHTGGGAGARLDGPARSGPRAHLMPDSEDSTRKVVDAAVCALLRTPPQIPGRFAHPHLRLPAPSEPGRHAWPAR